ncbi:MAG: hypothetical protein KY468_06810 [Armatimonadetes bacterium]|nr:hypothetical protein [Armatimonadota bacterium]
MERTSGQSPLQGRKGILLLLIAGLAVAGLYFLLRGGPPRTDTEQIQAILLEGERAVEEKDLSAIMGMVSKEFNMEQINRDRLRLMLAQTFREHGPIYVTLNDVVIQPQGDTATVSMNATVEAQGKTNSETVSNTVPVTLQLRREEGYRFLVIPTEVWRVTGASGTGLSFGGDLLGF